MTNKIYGKQPKYKPKEFEMEPGILIKYTKKHQKKQQSRHFR